MDETTRFKKIKDDLNELSNQKIRLEERFKNEKTILEKLLKEIKDKGYDPKKLSEIRKEKEDTLQKILTDLEKNITETKQKLNLIEV
jgi:hypothetical protein